MDRYQLWEFSVEQMRDIQRRYELNNPNDMGFIMSYGRKIYTFDNETGPKEYVSARKNKYSGTKYMVWDREKKQWSNL